MKRKNLSKKKGKKVESSVRSPESKADVKREFNEFAKKISKLESLKHELDSLDTTGFDQQANFIRAHLKDVNLVSQVEREIEDLKQKIIKRGGGVGKDSTKMHHAIREKINHLEKEINDKRKLSVKKQLSKNELDDVKGIPRLERQLKDLRDEFSQHKRAGAVKIDTGVDVIVDSKLSDFLKEIKFELTKRLQSKEFMLNARLKVNLEENEKLFSEKYRALVNEFHDKYRQKVDSELRKEVEERYSKDLNERLNEEKKKIMISLIQENARKIHEQKVKLVTELEREYDKKRKMLKNQFDEELNRSKREVEEQKKELSREESDFIKYKGEEFEAEKEHLRKKYEDEKRESVKEAIQKLRIQNLKEHGELKKKEKEMVDLYKGSMRKLKLQEMKDKEGLIKKTEKK